MVEALEKLANAAASAGDEPLMINTGGDGKPKVPDALREDSSDSSDDDNEYQPTEMNAFGFFSDSNDAVS